MWDQKWAFWKSTMSHTDPNSSIFICPVNTRFLNTGHFITRELVNSLCELVLICMKLSLIHSLVQKVSATKWHQKHPIRVSIWCCLTHNLVSHHKCRYGYFWQKFLANFKLSIWVIEKYLGIVTFTYKSGPERSQKNMRPRTITACLHAQICKGLPSLDMVLMFS